MTDTEQAVDTLLEALTFEVIKWNYGASSAEAAGERLKARTGIMRLISEARIEGSNIGIASFQNSVNHIKLAQLGDSEYLMYWDHKTQLWNRARKADLLKELSAPPTVQHRRTEIDINGNPSTITSHYPAKATPDTEEAL